MENLKWMKKVLLRPQDTKDYYNFKLNVNIHAISVILTHISTLMHFAPLMMMENLSIRKDCTGLTTTSAINVFKFVYAMVIIGSVVSMLTDTAVLGISLRFPADKNALFDMISCMFVSIAMRVGCICCLPVLLSCSTYESAKICCASLPIQMFTFFLILYDISTKVLAKENK